MRERMKKVILLTMLFCMACIMTKPQKVLAANTDIGSATPINFEQTYTDSITEDVYKRYYKIVLPSSGKINLSLESDMKFNEINIYDSAGDSMTYFYESKSNVTNKVTINGEIDLTAGTYYLGIWDGESWSTSYGNYQLKVSFVSANESFAETEGGTNNDIGVANPINFEQTYLGQIAYNDRVDYYKVVLPLSGKLTISGDADVERYVLCLFDEKGNKLNSLSVGRNSATNKSSGEVICHLRSGVYYCAVLMEPSSWGNYYFGNYQLKASFVSANESFAETGADDYISGANPIKLNQTYNGQICKGDNGDFYHFKIRKKDIMEICVSSDMVGEVFIYSANGTKIWSDYYTSQSTTGKYEANTIVTISPGDYYFKFYYDRDGNYSFNLRSYNETKKPSKIKLTSFKSSKKKSAAVKWKKVSNVSGYEIQYARNSKFKSAKKTSVSSRSSSKTIKKLKSRYKYYVRVRAYKTVAGKKKYGSWSKAKSVRVK